MTKVLKNKKGFTLIEIIAVLVILGILAAVAIPKFMSLIDDSKTQAAKAAVAEGVAQVNLASGKYLLRNGSTPNAFANLSVASPYEEGDFSIAFTGSGTKPNALVSITATGKAGTSVAGATYTKSNIPLIK